jgi:hypothetical protein
VGIVGARTGLVAPASRVRCAGLRPPLTPARLRLAVRSTAWPSNRRTLSVLSSVVSRGPWASDARHDPGARQQQPGAHPAQQRQQGLFHRYACDVSDHVASPPFERARRIWSRYSPDGWASPYSSSRARVNSFSFTTVGRAASHSCGDTIEGVFRVDSYRVSLARDCPGSVAGCGDTRGVRNGTVSRPIQVCEVGFGFPPSTPSQRRGGSSRRRRMDFRLRPSPESGNASRFTARASHVNVQLSGCR